MPNCPKCGTWTLDEECKHISHIHKCAVCGTCPDCLKYEKDLQRYEDMIHDPDYFFEPWDWSDYPESDRPKKPIERLTTFPDIRYHRIKSVSVNKSETAKKVTLFFVHVTFDVLAHNQVASHAYISGNADVEVTFDVVLDQPQFINSFSEPWNKFFRDRYTKKSLERFEKKIILLAEEFHKILEGRGLVMATKK